MDNFNTAKIMMSHKLMRAPEKMNLRQQRVFHYSLWALQKGQDRLFVRVDLNHFLGLESTPNSYTKEYIAEAFKTLKTPCICLDDEWIPAYTKAEWEGDTMLLKFHPKISDEVLGLHNIMTKIFQGAEEFEEQQDRQAIDEALAEQGDDPYTPLDQVKKELDSE